MKVISDVLFRLSMWKIVRVSTLFHESRKPYFNFTCIIVFVHITLKIDFLKILSSFKYVLPSITIICL